MTTSYSVGYVYVVTNTINGKQYVGQTTWTVAGRWRQHVSHAMSNKSGCRMLSRAIRKYGKEAFAVEHRQFNNITKDALDDHERDAISNLKTIVPQGYNLQYGWSGGRLHAETKILLSAKLAGHFVSEECRAKLSAAMTGRTASPETRAKLRARMLGSRLSPDTIAKIIANKPSTKGVPVSQEHAAKNRVNLAKLNTKPRSQQHKDRIGASQRGKVITVSTRRKISATLTGRIVGPPSAQTRARISAAFTPERKAMMATLLKYRNAIVQSTGCSHAEAAPLARRALQDSSRSES